MLFTRKLAFGALASLLTCTAAQAGNIFGVTHYKPLVEAPPAADPVPVVAPPLSGPSIIKSRRYARHHRGADRFAANQVETTPAPTPASAEKLTNDTKIPRSGDGPHEQGAPTLSDLIAKHANENGVPPKLASAVVEIESRFNPRARGGSAMGLMQIKVDTARSVGFDGGAAGLLQPDTNLRFGMKVLADAYRTSHGDICMTLARYQSGHRTTHMSAANRTYCNKARSIMAKA